MNAIRNDFRQSKPIIESLTDNPDRHTLILGCLDCEHMPVCGGLHVRSLFECLDLCCGKPNGCPHVCRNRPEIFVNSIREVDGFCLENIPIAPAVAVKLSDQVATLIYHGSGRQNPLPRPLIALRLMDLINFKSGALRFSSREKMCRHFCISGDAEIIVTGVDKDDRIEKWWGLGQERRFTLTSGLIKLGVKMVSTPNFSVILDRPRTDDLHSIKRIALVFAEFQQAGLACALHVNGRTETDFQRWGKHINAHAEIRTLSFEFTTGSARRKRLEFYIQNLKKIAQGCDRDLDIIVRGNHQVIPELKSYFRNVIYIESVSFMKSLKRQKAVRNSNADLDWQPQSTNTSEQLEELINYNSSENYDLLKFKYYGTT